MAGKPADAPPNVPWESDFKLFNKPTFASGVSAVSGFVFAYGGVPVYFSIVAEMRNPRHYTRSLIVSQTAITTVYIVLGSLVYYFCGSLVSTPALGSAGGTMKIICYALALPGLLVSTAILVHVSVLQPPVASKPGPANRFQVPAKYIFVRILRDSKHLVSNSATHWMIWLGCTFSISVSSYVVASAIPFFGPLTSLIGSFFGSVMSFQFMGIMWFYSHWSERKAGHYRWTMVAVWAAFVVVAGTVLMVAGTYGSVIGIMDYYKAGGGSSAWSCADNSNSAKR